MLITFPAPDGAAQQILNRWVHFVIGTFSSAFTVSLVSFPQDFRNNPFVLTAIALIYRSPGRVKRWMGKRLFVPVKDKQKGAPTGKFRFWYATG